MKTVKTLRTPKQEVLKKEKLERIKQAKSDAQKQPQVLLTGAPAIRARIAEREAKEALGQASFSDATAIDTVQVSNTQRKNYAVTETEVIIILENVLKNKRTLNVKKSETLAKKLQTNPNTTRMISEIAASLAFPETCKTNLKDAKEGRYFNIISAQLKLNLK